MLWSLLNTEILTGTCSYTAAIGTGTTDLLAGEKLAKQPVLNVVGRLVAVQSCFLEDWDNFELSWNFVFINCTTFYYSMYKYNFIYFTFARIRNCAVISSATLSVPPRTSSLIGWPISTCCCSDQSETSLQQLLWKHSCLLTTTLRSGKMR